MKTLRRGIAAAAFAAVTLLPAAAVAEKGDVLVRAGASMVEPKSNNLLLSPSTTVEIDKDTQLSFDVTYFIANNWGVELFAATPFNHGIYLKSGTTRTPFGSVDHLPPTLSLQYHFNPEGQIRPYVGAGLNYTLFSGERPSGLNLENSFGLGVQIGTDIGITDKWFVNLAARYLDINSKTKLNGAKLGTVEISPKVYTLHIGYKFAAAKPVAPTPPPPPPPVAAPPPPPVAVAPPPPPPPLDSDGDGVPDSKDLCPNTPKGDRVGPNGCSCDVTVRVNFATDSAALDAAAKKTLDDLIVRLKELQFISGTVEGHTDSTGSDAYNQKLSERRAKAVADYLQANGIASGRLSASGRGESQPVADNKTKDGRAQNRRVVLKRTDCDKP